MKTSAKILLVLVALGAAVPALSAPPSGAIKVQTVIVDRAPPAPTPLYFRSWRELVAWLRLR
jgi:hypothetical protein